MTLRELIHGTIGEIEFICPEGVEANWKLLDYKLKIEDSQPMPVRYKRVAFVHH